jgi:hypothetical protein
MIGRVHVDKGRSVLRCCLTAGIHLREAIALSLLEKSLLTLYLLRDIIKSVSILTLDSRLSVSTLLRHQPWMTAIPKLDPRDGVRGTKFGRFSRWFNAYAASEWKVWRVCHEQ